MSAEVQWLYEDEDKDRPLQELEEGEIVWAEGYGDGSGKDTCVMIKGGFLKIFRGHVTYEESEHGPHASVTDVEPVATVAPGEKLVGRVVNESGKMALLSVHNLGEGPEQHPGMIPAWN